MADGRDVYRVKGDAFSWASLIIKVDGEEFYGIEEINYEEKLERTKIRGTGRAQAPRGMTGGQYDVSNCSMVMHKDTAKAFRQFLASKAPDGKSYGRVEFTITVQAVEGDLVIDDVLYGCKLSGRTPSAKQGTDPLKETIPFDCLYVKDGDGLSLFDNSEGRY